MCEICGRPDIDEAGTKLLANESIEALRTVYTQNTAEVSRQLGVCSGSVAVVYGAVFLGGGLDILFDHYGEKELRDFIETKIKGYQERNLKR